MRIALGADHAGVALKHEVKRLLDSLGIGYDDCGTFTDESVDYPDVAAEVAYRVADGRNHRGILICGTGIGMAMAANKIAGVRAAPVTDLDSARLSREHNDANVLALGARILPTERALEIVRTFVDTPFLGGRHERRIRKIEALEQKPPATRA
jgi:ribose 5-phosphate isomerase B